MPDKDELVRQVGLAVRQMGAQSVLSSAAVAKHFDLHTTDLEVLDLIFIRGTASAGELAKATGLTSGSMTALIDRLMAKGYVTRHEDPKDRRKTLVRIDRKATAPIEAVYAPRQKAMFALWSSFENAQLKTVIDFLTRSTDLLVKCTSELRTKAPRPSPAKSRTSKTSS